MENLNQLIDTFGRVHNNLRISVTDRCNIRCFYCMPSEDVQFVHRSKIMSFEEIVRFIRLVVPLGVDKIRLTGGEPLVRKNIPELVKMIADIPGIKDIGITTNGILLPQYAQQLYDAGLRRINISLDALNAAKFKQITRRDDYDKVRAGIQSAHDAGFDPVKINAVSIRNLTEEEIVPFGKLARETGAEIRFIEFMPLDADNQWERDKVLFAHEIQEILSQGIMPLVPQEQSDKSAPASNFVFEDGVGRIGFISSISAPFCMSCNRFRITADGKLRNCLFSLEETDIRAMFKANAPDEEIIAAIRGSITAKKEGHEINTARFIQPDRPMYSIGG
ncbi:GTP 3',8-cyclase MoaA [Gimesia sp.]|uniref:GTP 3',8-cyclase MoaA n=1 Tax=Gimesia sp. TaxID=2024833 RepID=UPI000C37D80E|nr:GTP 3',8-cyclase MoaA [Gimesia sp.]MAX38625.1 GTP 3',8-cyclase MoaA [Gimesia sp.]HAH43244.1 GTP 3',8-cyclase MoaA [Planctomycetaceae bacterium]|tara:strand:+ start:604 stop:1605 length:1002 start_codon:yes stop_codon:yes gene_type:complete